MLRTQDMTGSDWDARARGQTTPVQGLLEALSCDSELDLLIHILQAERCGFTFTSDALNRVLDQVARTKGDGVRDDASNRLASTPTPDPSAQCEAHRNTKEDVPARRAHRALCHLLRLPQALIAE